MNKSPFIIIGYGGHAKCVIDALDEQDIEIHSIFDDAFEKNQNLTNLPCQIGPIPPFQWWKDHHFQTIIAIGANRVRHQLVNKLKGPRWGNSIHPSARISKKAIIGEGVYIGVNAIVQPGAFIGNHSIINTGVIIEHDVIIEEYCHIAPGSVITGGCKIGQGSLIGAGSIMIPGKSIGHWNIIGAGSNIVSHIENFQKAYGNPCRKMQELPSF